MDKEFWIFYDHCEHCPNVGCTGHDKHTFPCEDDCIGSDALELVF